MCMRECAYMLYVSLQVPISTKQYLSKQQNNNLCQTCMKKDLNQSTDIVHFFTSNIVDA